jgi:hypothetical protein
VPSGAKHYTGNPMRKGEMNPESQILPLKKTGANENKKYI